jgi:FkbM family methyltransferase
LLSNDRVRMEQIHPSLRDRVRKAGPQLDRMMRYWRTRIMKCPRPIDSWLVDRGDTTLRLAYPLTPESIVVDVGGYMGNWSQQIHDRYDCHIHIFEPVRSYWSEIEKRFNGCAKITVYPYGLADKTTLTQIAILGDASTVLIRQKEKSESIELRDVAEVLEPMRNSGIDLIKINIEGGEYDLVPRMIQTGLKNVCRNIQVQFHPWVPRAIERRKEIQEALSRTHRLTYEYPFVWENWQLR